MEQIKIFIAESIAEKKRWNRISILGGEPTLHPNFKEIVGLIHNEYIAKHSPETEIRIVSNRFTEKSRKLCEEVKEKYRSVFIAYISTKTENEIETFIPFNDAPTDDKLYTNTDYKKGCSITTVCGLGLNKRGYYACSVASGMDRIMKKDLAITHLKDITKDRLEQQLEEFCKYCGHFKIGNNHKQNNEKFKNKVSESWKFFYKAYQ